MVSHLIDLERRTGRRVKLALEPEPFCFLETTEETVRYFQDHVWSADGIGRLVRLTGLPASEVVGLVRRHLGVVFDICHQSVQFEDIAASLRLLRDSGVPIFKFQAAAALRVPEVTAEAIDALAPFTDTIYLSQTTESRDGTLTRRLNLSDAIDAWRADPTGQREWRTHFHLPIFLADDRWPPARLDLGSKRAWRCTRRRRSPTISRSRRTRGTFCPRTSRPGTSPNTSAVSWSGCATRW